jgi:hypothetical protein
MSYEQAKPGHFFNPSHLGARFKKGLLKAVSEQPLTGPNSKVPKPFCNTTSAGVFKQKFKVKMAKKLYPATQQPQTLEKPQNSDKKTSKKLEPISTKNSMPNNLNFNLKFGLGLKIQLNTNPNASAINLLSQSQLSAPSHPSPRPTQNPPFTQQTKLD